ncbi:MAG: S8 family peptidase [Verrucomicrobia bacterium]|nr:S8 family peptidase [Verrucomicrobiota bacterium]
MPTTFNRPRACFAFLFILLALGVPSVFAQAGITHAPGVVIIKFRSGADSVLVNRVMVRHGLKVQRAIARINVLRCQIPAGQHEELTARLLASYPIVDFAEPDYIRHASFTPTDPGYNAQWDMHKIRMPQAWDITRGAASVVVAVVDTGIDLDHPDLVNNLWRNPGEIAGNNIDDDSNGYIDDTVGWDFAGDGIFPLPAAQDNVPDDIADHGTHVSGTVAASQNNGIGITGVAPLCKIMPVRVLGGLLGTGYSSDIIEGIIYAVDNGAKVINMSLGGTSKSLGEYNAVKYAWDHNVFVAAAAGNAGNRDNPIEYPAGYPFTMGVGATGPTDGIAAFSSHNCFVEVSAPGVNILSTIPDNTFEQLDWSGTSMASPHVAGLAALLYARHPGIAVWEVRAMIQSGAVELGSPNWDRYYGFGRMDAATTLSLARPNTAVLRLLTPAPRSILSADTIVSFLWSPVSGAASYRLNAKLPNGQNRSFPVSGTYAFVHPNTFVPSGVYTISVDALNGDGSVIANSGQVAVTKTN